jgi:uncharacterized protein with PQ loop repeat
MDELKLTGWKRYYNQFMYVFAVLSQVWLLLQLIAVHQTKKTDGLSLVAFSLLAAGHMVWIIYGAFVMSPRNYIMIISSTLALMLTIGILIGILVY